MYPEVRTYQKHDTPTTEVAIESAVHQDLYLAMRPSMGKPFVSLLVVLFPLVSFLWAGALVMVIGGTICLIPAGAAAALTGRSLSRSTASIAWILVPLLALGLSAGPAHAAHGDARGESRLPEGGVERWEDAESALFDALWCPSVHGARAIRRREPIATCANPEGKALRMRLRQEMSAARAAGRSARGGLDEVLSDESADPVAEGENPAEA